MNTRKDMHLSPRPSPRLVVTGVTLGIALGSTTILAIERLAPAAPEATDHRVLIAARPTVEAVVSAAAARTTAARLADVAAAAVRAPTITPAGVAESWSLPSVAAPRPGPAAPAAAAVAGRATAAQSRPAPPPLAGLEQAMMNQRRELDPAAAATALAIAAGRAKRCLEPGDPRSTMPVRVTFAPSGQVTSATVVGGPFAGTEIGGCVAVALRSARVGAFEGPAVTVRRTVTIR